MVIGPFFSRFFRKKVEYFIFNVLFQLLNERVTHIARFPEICEHSAVFREQCALSNKGSNMKTKSVILEQRKVRGINHKSSGPWITKSKCITSEEIQSDYVTKHINYLFERCRRKNQNTAYLLVLKFWCKKVWRFRGVFCLTWVNMFIYSGEYSTIFLLISQIYGEEQ